MLSGKMPIERFPQVTECQGSVDEYYTKHIKYKIFPNIFLTDASGSQPDTSSTKFEKAFREMIPINDGIIINDRSCQLHLRSTLTVKNYFMVRYAGKTPLQFYGPKTKAGERFKLVISNNDLENRYFAKEEDLYISAGSTSQASQYE